MKKVLTVLLLVSALAMLIAGCGAAATATPAPTVAATQAPAPTAAPAPTVAAPSTDDSLSKAEGIIATLPPLLPAKPPADYSWVDDKPAKLGLAAIGLNAPYLVGYMKGLEAEAKRLNLELITLDANFDAAKQASQMDDLINQKVDVIAVFPVDAKAIAPSVKKAYDAGIKLVATNSWADPSVLQDFQVFVGASMLEEAQMAARTMNEALNGKGNVVICEGSPGTDPAYWRTKGFKDELAKIAPGIKILDSQPSKGWDKAACQANMDNFLTKYPQIDGAYGEDDTLATAMLQSAKAANRADKIKFVGIGASIEGLKAIKSGEMYGTCTQSGPWEGLWTARVSRDVANGWPPMPRWLRTPVIQVNKTNVDQVFGEW